MEAFSCPHCSQPFNAHPGQVVTCPHCGQYATAPGGVQPKAPRLFAELPAEPRPATPPSRAQFRCPFCGTTRPPEYSERLSVGGWIVLIGLLFVCFPLCWLCVFCKDKVATCSVCRITLGK